MSILTDKATIQQLLARMHQEQREAALSGEDIIDHPDGPYLWKKNPAGAVVKMSPDTWLDIKGTPLRLIGWSNPTAEEILAWQEKFDPEAAKAAKAAKRTRARATDAVVAEE